MTWISYQTSYLQTCTDQVAQVGNAPLVKSCGPLSLLDAPVLVLLVVGGLLLLPDLSAFEIPGIVRLENKVSEQAERQDKLIRTVELLSVKLEANQVTNLHLYMAAAEHSADTTAKGRRLIDLQVEKEEQFNAADTA